jgi:hypothetical protein
MRVGWVTAPRALLDKIIFHMQGIQLGANSFTQARCHSMHLCLQGMVTRGLPPAHACLPSCAVQRSLAGVGASGFCESESSNILR